ncbi:hypothetical protein O181_001887 [Austropuccinia psidii MF-1]|uniref:Uncharacterized protein n=1 Tax=Austropuccinia psidii MF-1 TaxID=1389203 RepID=A0A9Q3BBG9_9BASI|nr:hypothetical protein [Austropuccinia psidii MF-1]
MPIQHSPPERQTRSKARTQGVLAQIPRSPLDRTPAVPQLNAQLDKGLNLEGEEPSNSKEIGPRRSSSFLGVSGGFSGLSRTTFKGPGEEEEENSVEKEESDGTAGVPSPGGASQGTGGPTLAQYNQTVSHQSEPSSLAIMEQMTQIMANLQAD